MLHVLLSEYIVKCLLDLVRNGLQGKAADHYKEAQDAYFEIILLVFMFY